jgi:hypothetical protein
MNGAVVYVCMCVYIYIYIYAHIYMRTTHTHTHTHTRAMTTINKSIVVHINIENTENSNHIPLAVLFSLLLFSYLNVTLSSCETMTISQNRPKGIQWKVNCLPPPPPRILFPSLVASGVTSFKRNIVCIHQRTHVLLYKVIKSPNNCELETTSIYHLTPLPTGLSWPSALGGKLESSCHWPMILSQLYSSGSWQGLVPPRLSDRRPHLGAGSWPKASLRDRQTHGHLEHIFSQYSFWIILGLLILLIQQLLHKWRYFHQDHS